MVCTSGSALLSAMASDAMFNQGQHSSPKHRFTLRLFISHSFPPNRVDYDGHEDVGLSASRYGQYLQKWDRVPSEALPVHSLGVFERQRQDMLLVTGIIDASAPPLLRLEAMSLY